MRLGLIRPQGRRMLPLEEPDVRSRGDRALDGRPESLVILAFAEEGVPDPLFGSASSRQQPMASERKLIRYHGKRRPWFMSQTGA